jgi:hypothetical protein
MFLCEMAHNWVESMVVVRRRRWYPVELIRESVEQKWRKVEELTSF